jgi:S1-C subfamily serine protease
LDGQVVVGVVTGGPAQQAGLQKGDIVTHFNGKAASKGTQTMKQIADLMPGDVITLGIIRAGKVYEVRATLGKRLNQ